MQRTQYVYGYARQFEYKKTDRLKLGIARDVIDYFVGNDDLAFQSLLIPTAQYELGRYRTPAETSTRQPEVVSYNYRYKQIIRNNTPVRDELVVVLDERTISKDENLAVYLQREIPTRMCRWSTRRGTTSCNTHPVKRAIIEHLRSRLNVRRLTDRPLALERKFRVFEWKPPR